MLGCRRASFGARWHWLALKGRFPQDELAAVPADFRVEKSSSFACRASTPSGTRDRPVQRSPRERRTRSLRRLKCARHRLALPAEGRGSNARSPGDRHDSHDAHHRHRESERRGRQDDHGGQSRRGAGRNQAPHSARRSRCAGQRDDGVRHRQARGEAERLQRAARRGSDRERDRRDRRRLRSPARRSGSHRGRTETDGCARARVASQGAAGQTRRSLSHDPDRLPADAASPDDQRIDRRARRADSGAVRIFRARRSFEPARYDQGGAPAPQSAASKSKDCCARCTTCATISATKFHRS